MINARANGNIFRVKKSNISLTDIFFDSPCMWTDFQNSKFLTGQQEKLITKSQPNYLWKVLAIWELCSYVLPHWVYKFCPTALTYGTIYPFPKIPFPTLTFEHLSFQFSPQNFPSLILWQARIKTIWARNWIDYSHCYLSTIMTPWSFLWGATWAATNLQYSHLHQIYYNWEVKA